LLAYAGLTEEQYTPTGFSEIIDADILILGSANSYFFTDEISGGLISYRALLLFFVCMSGKITSLN
jgi:hypothetical protein